MIIDPERKINNYNHKNMRVLWNYLQDFAKKYNLKEDEINIFTMLNLPYPKAYSSAIKYYTDPDKWTTVDNFVNCYLKAKDITGDHNIYRNCGRGSSKHPQTHSFQALMKALSGIHEALNYCPLVINDWQNTKTIEIIDPAKINQITDRVTAIFKYKYRPHLNPDDYYCCDYHMLGCMESIPTNIPASFIKPWKFLPMGLANMVMVQYNPLELYSGKFFQHLNLTPSYKNNLLYIRDPNTNNMINIGRKVILESSLMNGNTLFLGLHKPLEGDPPAKTQTGTLITETVSFNGEPICDAGVIMSAPYFIFEYTCETTKRAQKTGFTIRHFLTAKETNSTIWGELEKLKLTMQREIDEKNKAYNDLKYYSDNLENIVAERTEELRKTSEHLRRLDQVVMRVVSHGLGNWSANAIADAHLAIHSIKVDKITDKTHEYLSRLVSNCGVAALSAIGLNYYCKKNITVTVQEVTDFLLRQAHLSFILHLYMDEAAKSVSVDGRIYMILSEIFQNAIKAQINQGYDDLLTMHISLDATAKFVNFTLTNRGKLHGNLQILKSMNEDFPDKHQGGWICKRLTKEIGGRITWTEEENSVKVILEIPFRTAE